MQRLIRVPLPRSAPIVGLRPRASRSLLLRPAQLAAMTTTLPLINRCAFSAGAARFDAATRASAASPKFPPRDPAIPARVYSLITKKLTDHDAVLFMKGTPGFPKCGFSRLASQILDYYGVKYDAVDVLEDEELRQSLKVFSQWPTIPQLFIKGELLGGCDILRGMHESGELQAHFEAAGVVAPKKAAAE